MPTYDFRCLQCGYKFTVLVGVDERDKVTCPECKGKDVEQFFSGCAVNLKTACSSGRPARGGG